MGKTTLQRGGSPSTRDGKWPQLLAEQRQPCFPHGQQAGGHLNGDRRLLLQRVREAAAAALTRGAKNAAAVAAVRLAEARLCEAAATGAAAHLECVPHAFALRRFALFANALGRSFIVASHLFSRCYHFPYSARSLSSSAACGPRALAAGRAVYSCV